MATSNTVVVGCKLPHGIVLTHPIDETKTVTLNGANRAKIVGADYGLTDVDSDFWEHWHAFHKDNFPPLKSGAIFFHKTQSGVEGIGAEYAERLTGFERMPQKMKDIKPADNNE